VVERPWARAELDTIPGYLAGRAAPVGAVKLSSNENPFPPLPGVEAAIASAAADVNRYPDFGSTRLLQALAVRHGVATDQVTVGTGSVAVLAQVITAYAGAGDEVVLPWRSFEAYPIVVQLSGATQVRVPLRSDHTHDLPAMAAAITDRTRVVLVCTPNNPTGTTVSRTDLEQFLDMVPPTVLIAVDEAYVEFARDAGGADAMDLVSSRPNVVVLRTFSKAYGLAALRVGYGVGPADVVEQLRKTQLPFGVSSMAQSAALAALAGERELSRRVEVLVAERARVMEQLRDCGVHVPPSGGNFVWLPLGARADAFASACAAAGVMVRPFTDEGVRVTVGEPAANERWLAVLRDFLGL
jgi:histidinol-phosphate aminotransferase